MQEVAIATALLELAELPPSTMRLTSDVAVRSVAFRHPEWSGHVIRGVARQLVKEDCVRRAGFRITTKGLHALHGLERTT